MAEATIGFDLRSTLPGPSWIADRRAVYLLRRDVPAVRSVDRQVWTRPPGLPQAPAIEQLWPSHAEVLAAAQGLDLANTMIVQITADLEDDESGPVPDQASLIGFDVADYWLMSGLANCGYSPEEAASLTPVWAPLLNEWHLFSTLADATAYAEVTDQRVPEHAPFYAYGIYAVQLSRDRGPRLGRDQAR
jgi:hypothetical protein